MNWVNGIYIALALVSIFAEVFKIWKIDTILDYHNTMVKINNLEDTAAKVMVKNAVEDVAFKTPTIIIALVTDSIYSIFTFVLLMTAQWYIGLVIILMTYVQNKFFKYQKKTMIIDSIMCIMLLIAYIILL